MRQNSPAHLLPELGEHGVDGAEHVEVRGGADVTLVGGEAEDGHRKLLLLVLLRPQVGPLQVNSSASASQVKSVHSQTPPTQKRKSVSHS